MNQENKQQIWQLEDQEWWTKYQTILTASKKKLEVPATLSGTSACIPFGPPGGFTNISGSGLLPGSGFAIPGSFSGSGLIGAFRSSGLIGSFPASGFAYTSGFSNTSGFAYTSGFATTSGFSNPSGFAYTSGFLSATSAAPCPSNGSVSGSGSGIGILSYGVQLI